MTRSEEEICKSRADEDLHDRTAQCRSSLPHNTRQLRLPAGEDQHEDPSDTPEQAPTTKILLRPNHHSSSPSSPRKPSRGPTHRQSATCQLRRRVRPAHQETRMGARFSRRRPKGGRRREKRRPSPDRTGLGFPPKSLLRGWERSKKTPWRRLQGGERRPQAPLPLAGKSRASFRSEPLDHHPHATGASRPALPLARTPPTRRPHQHHAEATAYLAVGQHRRARSGDHFVSPRRRASRRRRPEEQPPPELGGEAATHPNTPEERPPAGACTAFRRRRPNAHGSKSLPQPGDASRAAPGSGP